MYLGERKKKRKHKKSKIAHYCFNILVLSNLIITKLLYKRELKQNNMKRKNKKNIGINLIEKKKNFLKKVCQRKD